MNTHLVLTRTARVLSTGALPGALVYALLFVLSVVFHASAEYMGVEDTTITDRLLELFDEPIKSQQLGILALHLGLGVALGLMATLALGLRDALLRPPYIAFWGRSKLDHFAVIAGLVFLQHLFVLIASMAAHPAVYAFTGEQLAPMGWLLWIAVDLLPSWLAAFLPWLFPTSALVFGAILLARHPPAFVNHRRALPLAAALALTFGIALALAARPPRLAPATAHPSRPNVIILAVDSLRADLLREHSETVPNLAALARAGTYFSRAIPTVPRTYPSWASMLTGRYPHDHGIRHMFPLPPVRGGLVIEHGLPETLRKAGYRTGVVSDFAGDVFRRGDWGFETVDTPNFTLASNVALGGVKLHVHLMPWLLEAFPSLGFEPYREELLALERLADPAMIEEAARDFVAADPDRPFFLVAFFSAGHFPFASPSPWWEKFDPDYRGRSRFLRQSFGQALDGPAFEAEKAHLSALYRGGIAASDDAIGRLLADLRDGGALANTIVIVTADHGENLYEHGLGMGHGDHLYGRTTTEVPLVIDYPNNPDRGRVFEMPVSLADVGATIAGLLDLDGAAFPPLPEVAGVDLTTAIRDPEALARRPVFSEIDLWFFPPETKRLDGKRIVGVEGFAGFTFDPETWAIFLDRAYQPMSLLAKHRMVLADGRKLIYIPTRDGVRWELYDPLADPGDAIDLADNEPERLEALRAKLWSWMLCDHGTRRVGEYLMPREDIP